MGRYLMLTPAVASNLLFLLRALHGNDAYFEKHQQAFWLLIAKPASHGMTEYIGGVPMRQLNFLVGKKDFVAVRKLLENPPLTMCAKCAWGWHTKDSECGLKSNQATEAEVK